MQVRKYYQAFVAVRRLIKDPEDTEQVFRVLGSLRGKAHERLFERLRHTEVGQQVLNGSRNLADTLTDRESLSSLPEGSLGRTYLPNRKNLPRTDSCTRAKKPFKVSRMNDFAESPHGYAIRMTCGMWLLLMVATLSERHVC